MDKKALKKLAYKIEETANKSEELNSLILALDSAIDAGLYDISNFEGARRILSRTAYDVFQEIQNLTDFLFDLLKKED